MPGLEDKVFDLMTTMYSDFTKRFDKIEGRLDNLENGQKQLENGQKKLENILENEIKHEIKVLFDGYKQTYEKLTVIENKVDNLADRVEKQDVEIRVIKGSKKTKVK